MSEKYLELKKQINRLERQEEVAISNIEALDPARYPSKREKMASQLSQGLQATIMNLRTQLSKIELQGSFKGELETMKWMRLLALMWNILLIHSFASRPQAFSN